MQAKDIMVSRVISIGQDLTVREAANTLVKNKISAAPVVDQADRLVGLLSEGDLIRRVETQTERRRSRWREFFKSSEDLATEFVKANAHRVTDVMTRKVITAGPDTPLRDIANLLEKHRIKRVPIVKNGRVVGIVSRADLTRAVACAAVAARWPEPLAGESLRQELVTQLWSQSWSRPTQINVVVEDSTVELWGHVESDAQHRALRVLAEQTPGVRVVRDHLAFNRIQSAL